MDYLTHEDRLKGFRHDIDLTPNRGVAEEEHARKTQANITFHLYNLIANIKQRSLELDYLLDYMKRINVGKEHIDKLSEERKSFTTDFNSDLHAAMLVEEIKELSGKVIALEKRNDILKKRNNDYMCDYNSLKIQMDMLHINGTGWYGETELYQARNRVGILEKENELLRNGLRETFKDLE